MFENVSFSYPLKPKDPIMKQLQFTATRGQTVALVGPSGCGKSTAIALLERFYDVARGSVVGILFIVFYLKSTVIVIF